LAVDDVTGISSGVIGMDDESVVKGKDGVGQSSGPTGKCSGALAFAIGVSQMASGGVGAMEAE